MDQDRLMRAGRAVLFAMGALLAAAGARADPVRVYAAGSLSGAMQELIGASGLPAAAFDKPVFGPAGLLRERLERGEQADLFASADLAQPTRLAGNATDLLVVPFARNRMCVVSRKAVGLTAENLLDRLLAPGLRLATSTPAADPGGDYAWAVFARADALRPGARSMLEGKALKLLGSPDAMVPLAGHSPAASIFLSDRADALLYYCSGVAATLREVENLAAVPLPPGLEVGPVYGMMVRAAKPDAMRLALFIISTRGQEILARQGLLPILDAPR